MPSSLIEPLWVEFAALLPALPARCLAAFDTMIGLRLGDISADAASTKASYGGEKAGPSPVTPAKAG